MEVWFWENLYFGKSSLSFGINWLRKYVWEKSPPKPIHSQAYDLRINYAGKYLEKGNYTIHHYEIIEYVKGCLFCRGDLQLKRNMALTLICLDCISYGMLWIHSVIARLQIRGEYEVRIDQNTFRKIFFKMNTWW